jgi:hypothetical protein
MEGIGDAGLRMTTARHPGAEATLATRRLCIGVYTDNRFCQRVLLDAYADRSRHVAPSYGFELAQVALHARRAWWVDLAQHAAVLTLAVVALLKSPLTLVFAGIILTVWYFLFAAARLAGDFFRYVRDQQSYSRLANFKVRTKLILGKFLAAVVVLLLFGLSALGFTASFPSTTPDVRPVLHPTAVSAFRLLVACCALIALAAAVRQALVYLMLKTGRVPDERLNPRLKYIADDERLSVTYYADYRPFVGSGEELATWSLPIRLSAKSAKEQDKVPFRAKKLVKSIRRHLEKLAAENDIERGLPNFQIADRTFIVGEFARHLAADPAAIMASARSNPTGPARHYLSCKIEAWDGEVVTTVFVHTSMQGHVLYLEFSVWALLPTRPDFHVPHVVDRRRFRGYARDILHRIIHLPDEIQRLPADVWTVPKFLSKRLPRFWERGPRHKARNPGARYSAREDGAVSRYVAQVAASTPTELVGVGHRNVLLIEEADAVQERLAVNALNDAQRLSRQAARAVNYFQIRDVERHWKIIERRVIAALQDFLERQGIDATEYQTAITQILNTTVSVFNGSVDARGSSWGSGSVNNETGR